MTYLYVDTPSDRTSVISSIVDFAVANAGFTLVDGSGDFQCISKDSLYWCFNPVIFGRYNWSGQYAIDARLTSSIPTSSDYTTVTGQYSKSGLGTDNYTGPFVGLHLFTDGSELNCVLEIVSGAFSHLNFGSITKFGSYTGGQYLTGSVYTARGENLDPWSVGSSRIQPYDGGLTVDTSNYYVPYYFRNAFYYDSVFYAEGATVDDKRVIWGGVGSTCHTPLYTQGQAAYNYRTPLLPIYAIIDVTSAQNKVVGVSSQARFLNLTGLQNKEIIESNWMVFPYSQRSSILGNGGYDAAYGLAYKK